MENYTPQNWKKVMDCMRKDFFKSPESLNYSLDYAKVYGAHFGQLIQFCAQQVYFELFGTKDLCGVALFSFGAPCRNEMIGSSDLDIAVYRENNAEKSIL